MATWNPATSAATVQAKGELAVRNQPSLGWTRGSTDEPGAKGQCWSPFAVPVFVIVIFPLSSPRSSHPIFVQHPKVSKSTVTGRATVESTRWLDMMSAFVVVCGIGRFSPLGHVSFDAVSLLPQKRSRPSETEYSPGKIQFDDGPHPYATKRRSLFHDGQITSGVGDVDQVAAGIDARYEEDGLSESSLVSWR